MDRKGVGVGIGLAFMVAIVAPVQAEKVYRWVDPQGNIVYQDKPPPSGAGKVEIKEINPEATTTQFERPNITQSEPAAGEGDTTSSPARPDQRAQREQRARQRAFGGGAIEGPASPPTAGVVPLLPTPSAGLPGVPAAGALAPPPPPPPPAPGAF